MSTFTYELKRTLSSKTVITLAAVIISLSLVLSVYSASSANGGGPLQNTHSLAYGYETNGSFDVVVYIYNGYGSPVQGANVRLAYWSGAYANGTTDASGYANFTGLPGSDFPPAVSQDGHSTLIYNYTTVYGFHPFQDAEIYGNQSSPYFLHYSYSYYNANKTKVNVSLNDSRFAIEQTSLQNQPDRNGLTIHYEGALKRTSPGFRLYYLHLNQTPNSQTVFPPPLYNLNESNMTYYGTYEGSNTYHLSLSNLTAYPSTPVYYFAVFMPNGTFVGYSYIFISNIYSDTQATSIFFQGDIIMLGFFVPLMATVSAYATFGRDRTSGVMESVLARPVTRRKLMVSRYLANNLAAFLAVLLSLFSASFVFDHYLGVFLPINILLIGSWAMLVSIAAFIGLVYLASNFLKSQGALIGFSVGIFILMDIFWIGPPIPVIPLGIISGVLGISPGVFAYAKVFIAMLYATPAGYSSIASIIVTGGSGFLPYGLDLFSRAALGITNFYYVLFGSVWIAAPFVAALLTFNKRD